MTLRILVYPHTMEVGGSQLNAIELAAAVRDLGHQVAVAAEPGPLVETVDALGLDRFEIPASRRRPSPTMIRMLTRIVSEGGYDVVHGYEWPPAVESFLGPHRAGRRAAVATVMSAEVAPFIPVTMPLVVGTDELARSVRSRGYRDVTLIEPPVDVLANSPSFAPGRFRADHGLDGHFLVVVVCRLVRELKLEGLLTACDAVANLVAAGTDARLAIVGDGPERWLVEERAGAANARCGTRAVVLTGQLADPRPAYAAADAVLGMGGSALRGMAFGKPLIVQGELGFWRPCTPDTVGSFLTGGWYGLGDGSDGTPGLERSLRELIDDPALRARLGDFARRLVVGRFGLTAAAQRQLDVYRRAVAGSRARVGRESARCVVRVGGYKLRRRLDRLHGRAATDDFNSLARMRQR